MAEIFAAAKENRVALEINSHWMRLDLRDTHVREAVRLGCLIAIDCDVHEREDFDNLRYGVATARRGWVRPTGCVNAWSALDIRTWCHRNRR
jgi:DNA polymerase (family 10)